MTADSVTDVTESLLALRDGEEGAFDRVFDLVYTDLKRIARAQLRRLRPGQTLDTTGLVHEACLKFVDQSRFPWEHRSHFFAVAACARRQILVDKARRAGRAKRGGGVAPLELDESRLGAAPADEQILIVDEALERLSAHSERLARVVEYRFFAGFTEEEIADLLSVSSRTVRNDWVRARAWLAEAMGAS